jgi:hypothetical protein
VSNYFSKAEARQAAAFHGSCNHATARLRSLMQTLSGKDLATMEFDNLRTLIESLPLASSDFSLAGNYLRKAQRYLRSNEIGAALYELRLLLDCLQCC